MKKHYHLISARLTFVDPTNEPEMLREEFINGTMVTENGQIGLKELGKAHESVQMRFLQATGRPDLQVQQVFILGISSLGKMTEQRFVRGTEAASMVSGSPTDAAENDDNNEVESDEDLETES